MIKDEGRPTTAIRRSFVDVSTGQVHYRRAGQGTPLVLFHASPGSAKQMEGLIARLAQHFDVIAPDTPGNGDSTPLPGSIAVPTMLDYAKSALEFLDAMGLDRVDTYGTHTGAGISCELAILAPERIRTCIQDGAPLFAPDERVDYLANYASPFLPTLEGDYLIRAFTFCRDQFFCFPWYKRDPAHLRDGGLPPAEVLHDWLVEVLKASSTYHHAYRAAFAYDAESRLPLVRAPVLGLGAVDDPLRPETERVISALPRGDFVHLPRYDDPHYWDALADAVRTYICRQG